MNNFQLSPDGSLANKIGTGEWHNTATSAEYLAWLAEGNTPDPAPEPSAPPEPTLDEKLASIGLSLDDLKEALK